MEGIQAGYHWVFVGHERQSVGAHTHTHTLTLGPCSSCSADAARSSTCRGTWLFASHTLPAHQVTPGTQTACSTLHPGPAGSAASPAGREANPGKGSSEKREKTRVPPARSTFLKCPRASPERDYPPCHPPLAPLPIGWHEGVSCAALHKDMGVLYRRLL